MCSLNRSMSLSMFPREPAAGLDATVDYVKVGTANLPVCFFTEYQKKLLLLPLELQKRRVSLWF